MQVKRFLRPLWLMLFFTGLAWSMSRASGTLAAGNGSEKIAPELLQRLQTEGQVDFFVRFAAQIDLSAAENMDWSERGWYVYNTLTETAQRSQVRAQAYLQGQGVSYRSFIAGNELYVSAGNLEQASSLARFEEVAKIFVPPIYQITPTETNSPIFASRWAGELLANHTESTVLLPDTVTWGIDDVNANEFWDAFYVQGDSILVANIDTGVRYTHDALENKYACYDLLDHTNCWFDPDDLYSEPTDGQGHGTHTMGTMVGLSPDNIYQIGMAPHARWIACQGCDTTGCEAVDLAACADWILAPGGSPDNRPHVVNNSWGSTVDGDTWYLDRVIAWRAAGIFPAFSAGNNGPNCGTLGDPGSFQESFASMAHNSTGLEYTMGSRGPSAFGHEPYTKPNLSAPGVDIVSSFSRFDTDYLKMDGTSMASPHTAGAVALLWSCNPDLIGQIDATFQWLQNTARTPRLSVCGTPPDGEGNYSFGYGYLDVLQAGYAVCAGALTGFLQGHVYDVQGSPLFEATVSVTSDQDHTFRTLTDASGAYSLILPVGEYAVTAYLNGFLAKTVAGVRVVLAETTTQDFNLTFLGLWTPQTWSPCSNLTRFDAEYFPGNGLVYILGGRYVYESGGLTMDTTDGKIFAFNPQTGVCEYTTADMPIPVSDYTISLLHTEDTDLLCTFGGRTATEGYTLAVQCYDPLANQVEIIANLPTEPYTDATPGAQVVVNNQVYLIGGLEFDDLSIETNLVQTFRFDPVTKGFTQLGNLSMARGYIMTTVVDGRIYAFGGDIYNGSNTMTAQIRTEVMADPEGTGSWDDVAVAELPLAAGEGRAFGFDSDSGYDLAGKIVLAAMSQWADSSYEVITYDVLSNTYDMNYPNLNLPRRNHAGVFIPLTTPTASDGLPGMWVLGGFCTGGACGGDLQPYGVPEFFPVNLVKKFYIPIVLNANSR